MEKIKVSMRLAKHIKKLESARKKAKKIREEIKSLRQTILDAGGDPDTWKPNNADRNKELYRKWKSGMKFSEIAREHHLSATTISTICHRIEKMLERKKEKQL
jgi:Mor family transcriptional regulator